MPSWNMYRVVSIGEEVCQYFSTDKEQAMVWARKSFDYGNNFAVGVYENEKLVAGSIVNEAFAPTVGLWNSNLP